MSTEDIADAVAALIDRRKFLKRIGGTAAGVAFGGTFLTRPASAGDKGGGGGGGAGELCCGLCNATNPPSSCANCAAAWAWGCCYAGQHIECGECYSAEQVADPGFTCSSCPAICSWLRFV